MKTETQASAVQFTSNAISSSSWGSSNSKKYAGMIETSWKKKTQQNFIQLYSYINSVAPRMSIVHVIITLFRFAQLIIPSLLPGEVYLWGPENSQPFQTISYLTVIATYFPLEELFNNWFFIFLFMALLKIVMLLWFYFSSNYYAKNAVLPKSTPIIFNIYLSTVGILLEPPCWNLVGKVLGDSIFEGQTYQIKTRLILAGINVILSILYFYVFVSIKFRNLEFHDFSCQTVLGRPQELLFISTCVLNFSIGVSSNGNQYSSFIFIPVMIITYIMLYFICYVRGGFVKSLISVTIKGISVTGAVLCAFELIYISFVGTIDLVLLWAGISLMILIMIASIFMERNAKNKVMSKLDLFMDDPDEYDAAVLFGSPNKLINAIVIGFTHAHPVCIDWSIFRSGVEIWPKNLILWTIFAKFAAIYPSEVGLLTWIFHTVRQSKLKGEEATSIKQNITAIMRTREATLTPDLKNKINVLTKSILNAKLKLRHVWDAVIQGNTGDVEVMSKIAIKAVSKLDADFKHILRQFPNNRFVTRTYFSFLHDVQADHELAAKYQERSKLLGRGIPVVSDEPHELAMIAFPNIPESLKTDQLMQNQINDTNLQITVTEDFINDDDSKDENELEQIAVLRKKLANIVVPTTRNLVITRVVIFLLLLLAPFIYIVIYDIQFPSTLNTTSSTLETITVIRNYNAMCPLLVTWYIYECMGVLDDPGFKDMRIPMEAFNNKSSSYDLVNVLLKNLAENVQQLESVISNFKTTTDDLKNAYEMVSSDSIEFTYYRTWTDYTVNNISLQQALLTIIQSAVPLQTTAKDKVKDLRNSPVFLNPMAGSLSINLVLNDVMSILIADGKVVHAQTQEKDDIIIIVYCIAFVITQIVYQILEIKYLVSVKVETYKALIALPKNVVSQVAEQLRVLKKDSSQSEMTQNDQSDINKQEENILKVLATSGSNAALDDVIILVSSLSVICVLAVFACFMLVSVAQNCTSEFVNSAPHINYFVGSISMRFGAVFNLLNLAIDNEGDDLAVFHDPSYWYEWGPTYLKTSVEYANQVRFGGTSSIETPFASYGKLQNDAYLLTVCNNEKYIPVHDIMDYIHCYDPEAIQYTHYLLIIQAFHLDNYSRNIEGLESDRYKVHEKKDELRQIYTILVFYLYDNFYYRSFYKIVPSIHASFQEIQQQSLIVSIVLIVLCFVAEIVHICRIKFIEKHVKDVLNLLLHCPITAIFQTPKIMAVLNGNFSPAKNDMTNRNEKFFRDVVECVPDAIIVTKNDFTVVDANDFCERLLGKSKDSMLEKNIYDIFIELKMTGNMSKLTPTQNQSEVLSTTGIISRGEESANVIVELSHVNSNLVYLVRDNTQTVRYNTLIEEERKKSDDMLASILPPSLVKRVQAGEKNISFSVQSATVLFLDVVSFTPWCGSHDAKTVMDTLNLFFKKLDYLASTYPTITKIKCIGDCYMCAGGIFMEVNQPTEHAREVVSFGLDALDALKEVNKEMNQELQIRVGINSGGPLVAGVLGVGKPTFEILGPTINMAQQMEHHGVPSKVHVSRSVYELIYGDSFVIKERGTIEVKQGNVVTYLVERKN